MPARTAIPAALSQVMYQTPLAKVRPPESRPGSTGIAWLMREVSSTAATRAPAWTYW